MHIVKLNLFKSLVYIVKPILKKYQAYKPLILFLFCNLKVILRNSLELVAESVIQKWKTVDRG